MAVQDKMIKADSTKQTVKLFNAGSFIALGFIILTAGFMVFQNLRITEELSDTQVIATAFAEGIQTMCADEIINTRYTRMCSIARDYADREHYLGTDSEPLHLPDIRSITCQEGVTIIKYKDGTESIANVQCDTTNE